MTSTISPKRKSLNIRPLAKTRAMIDQRTMQVSPQAYEAFLAQLNAPPAPNPALHKTLHMVAPWDESH